jgi:hypothetical protein
LIFGTGSRTRTKIGFPVPFICGTQTDIFERKKFKKFKNWN